MYWIWVFILVTAVYASDISLPSYPLAVKSPYLSTWLPYKQSLNVSNAIPEFWAGQSLTWPILARVNGQVYSLFACPGCGVTAAQQKSLQFTSTHTTIGMEAGNVLFTLDFFSPVSVTDYVRQSLPYSYLTVSAPGNGGKVEIFSGIDQSWTAQGNNVQAQFQNNSGTQIFILSGTSPVTFGEVKDMAINGDTVFASLPSASDSLSCASGPLKSLVSSFSNTGSLSGLKTTFQPGDLVACAHSFASTMGTVSATFAVGLQRNDAIFYFDGVSNSTMTGYFRSVYQTVVAAVSHFLSDYAAAEAESRQLDALVVTIGSQVSSNYTDVLEASVRQSFGGLEVTIPADTLNTSQAMAFMKEISTDGNVNTVADLLPKAMPIFYVLAPEYIRLLTEPVLTYSYSWPLNHVVHDLGKHYPNATGETPCIEEFLPLDSDSVIFWLVYGYQKASGNTQWAKPYLPLLQKYTDYLVDYGLYPVLQRSSTDSIGPTPNQTVLAMQAAISLKAFGALSGMANYSALGDQFAQTIYDLGTDPGKTHFLAHYNDPASSWVITYPLAIDKLLGLNTFNSSVYQMQSNWYIKQEQEYGIPYSNTEGYTILELEVWAASTSSNAFQQYTANTIRSFFNDGLNNVPGPTEWKVTGQKQGVWIGNGEAKSNIGSSFMIAAVSGQNASSLHASSSLPARSDVAEVPHLFRKAPDLSSRTSQKRSSSAAITIPATVPANACRSLAPGFVGLSIETSSFPAYAGSASSPNIFTCNLIDSLASLAGTDVIVRVGGASGDTATYVAGQQAPVSGSSGNITLGPSFFDGFAAVGKNTKSGAVKWVWMAPLADFDPGNAVQQTKLMVQNAGSSNVYSIEVGNAPNQYANVYRPVSYTCQEYAAQSFEIASYIHGNVSVPSPTYFEALNLASGPITAAWTVEACFTAGIDAVQTVKTVSSYYYQIDNPSAVALLGPDLMNHTAITSKFGSTTLPQVQYQTGTFPCIDYVLGEVGSSSAMADSSLESTFGAALWAVDLMLYAISHNVSKSYMQQAVGYAGSSWQVAADGSPNDVLPSFYALAYMASFVGNATSLRVVPVLESASLTAYAGYENGQPSRIAIVNLQEWNATTTSPATRPSQVLQFQVPNSVSDVTVQRLMGPGASSPNNITWAGSSWTAASQGNPVQVSNTTTTVPVQKGSFSVTAEASEALLLTLN